MQFLKRQWEKAKTAGMRAWAWTKRHIKSIAGTAIIAGATIGGGMAMPATEPTDTEKIRAFQEDYFQKHGEYFQLLPDQKLPTDATERMNQHAEENLKMNLSTTSKWRVDVSQRPSKFYENEWAFSIRAVEELEKSTTTASLTATTTEL